MPGMNGLKAAELIRAKRPQLPLIIITGYADVAFTEPHGDRLRVLNKPFQRTELAEALIAAIADAAAVSGNVVRLTSALVPGRAGRGGG